MRFDAELRESGSAEEFLQPVVGEPVEVVRLLVKAPYERCGEQKASSGPQNSIELVENLGRSGNVLENLCADHGVEGMVGEWNAIKGSDDIHVPGGGMGGQLPIESGVVAVSEELAVWRLAGTRVQHT